MKVGRVTLESVLLGGVWAFGSTEPEQEFWGKMVFLPNGRTFGYDHPNEYGWDFVDNTFRLLRKGGEPTSIFGDLVKKDGRMRLVGRSVLSPGSMYCLEQVDAAEI